LAGTARIAILTLLLIAAAQPAIAASEPGYESAEEAFDAAFLSSGIGRRGYEENREYAAALYQMPDRRWYATPVVAGGRVTSAIPYHLIPPGAMRIAGVHTHGQPTIPEDPSRSYGLDFSQTDRRNAVLAYQASHGRIDRQILLNSRLDVLEMTVGPIYDAKSERLAITTQAARVIESAGPPLTRASWH
jgi:hypothetical protein